MEIYNDYWFSVTCELYDPILVIWSYFYNASYTLAYFVIAVSLAIVAFRLRKLIPVQLTKALIAFGLFIIWCGGGHGWDVLATFNKTPIFYYTRAVWQTFGAIISLTVAIYTVRAVYTISTNGKAREIVKDTLNRMTVFFATTDDQSLSIHDTESHETEE